MNFLLTSILCCLISRSLCATSARPSILTANIRTNRLTEAKSLSEVKGLPNAPHVQSYSGFLTVDSKYNSNLFFWFFPTAKADPNAQVVLWLEGGPGSSSMLSLFTMHGPYKVDNGVNVTLNPYSWTQEMSVIYVDNPVGTGFSFTDDEKGYSTNENQIADNLYEFLTQFYQIFAEYRENELYIVGESYAGKYVPALGYKFMQMANVSKINFKGIAVGNGATDEMTQLDEFEYLKSVGLIDKKQQDELKLLVKDIRQMYKDKDYANATKLHTQIYLNIDNSSSYAGSYAGYNSFHNLLYTKYPWNFNFVQYLDQKATRTALHVPDVGYSAFNRTVAARLANDDVSVMERVTALIPHYKVMFYVGNLDMFLGPVQNNAMLENEDWKYSNQFYHAKKVVWRVSANDTEVAGYAKGFDNFVQVIVRNAGHAVAIDQPRSCLDLMKRFVRDIPFDD